MNKLRLSTQLIVILFVSILLVPIFLLCLIVPAYKMPLAEKIYENLSYQLNGTEEEITDAYYIVDGAGNVLYESGIEDYTKEERESFLFAAKQAAESGEDSGEGVISTRTMLEKATFYVFKKTADGNLKMVMTTDYQTTSWFSDNETTRFSTRIALFALIPICLIILWYAYVGESIRSIEGMVKNSDRKPIIASEELRSLARSIEVYKAKIEEDTNQKQSLFQNISHELKTPITTIKMYAEGIEDGIYLNGDIESSLQVIKDESDILLNRVNKIMEMNKLYHIDTKMLEPCRDTINLSEEVFNILDLYAKRAPNVKFVPTLEKASFRGDTETWNTILQNIIDNNLKYGAKNISIAVSNGRLAIENDGEKIDEALLPRIFEPFVKGEKGNFGLGLNIIHKSLDVLGYNISISNTEKGVLYLITDKSAQKRTVRQE